MGDSTTAPALDNARTCPAIYSFVRYFHTEFEITGGLWLVWSKDRVKAGDGANKSGRLNSNNCSVLFSSLHFSIISAFSVGLKDLDVGSWIARLFPWEYTIRGTGWVRSVSGLQSMISVY